MTPTLYIIDWVLFILTMGTVCYMAVFAIGAIFYKQDRYPQASQKARFLILIPAYAEDEKIEFAIMSLLDQDYNRNDYDIMVISDHMSEMTNFRLAQYPIHLLLPRFQEGESSKAKSLSYAMKHIPTLKCFDMVIVLDANNLVDENFLKEINNAFQAGTKIVQAHRTTKNRNTPSALLGACFEEINNTIFRKGHVQLGYSASLIGSGIGFEYDWFRKNVDQVFAIGEDKEFEALLLRQGLFIEYLDGVMVYEEKKQAIQNFNKQRHQWMVAQINALYRHIKKLPMAIVTGQSDYADKIIQWMLIPRTLLMGIIMVMCIMLPFFSGLAVIKWYIIGAFIMLVYAVSLPDFMVTKDFRRFVLKAAPMIMWGAITNLLHLKPNKQYDDTTM